MKETRAMTAEPGKEKPTAGQTEYANKLDELKNKFDAALDDDFNTAQALGYVFDAARLVNQITTAEKKMPVPAKQAILAAAADIFIHFGNGLGVFQSDPDVFFQVDRDIEVEKRGLNAADIEAQIEERRKAREEKDWTRADDIRKALALQKVTLKDSKGRTTWSIE
jgi:cysteinyl-tRNA synthetase